MPWRVIAEDAFTAAYGARVLSFAPGDVIEGEIAHYLATTGAPVLPADQDSEPGGDDAVSSPKRGPTRGVRRRG